MTGRGGEGWSVASGRSLTQQPSNLVTQHPATGGFHVFLMRPDCSFYGARISSLRFKENIPSDADYLNFAVFRLIEGRIAPFLFSGRIRRGKSRNSSLPRP